MNQSEYLEEIKTIKSIMERSTKFISLSGISGVLAGIYALIGAYFGNRIIASADHLIYRDLQNGTISAELRQLVWIAGLVLIMASLTGIILSYFKAQKQGRKVWNAATKRMLLHFLLPLFVGGVFIVILFLKQYLELIGPSTLIFYGLSLVMAGNFTYSDIRYLGLIEIGLGLIAGFFPSYGLYFWTLGFGILHIVYGLLMHFKYER